MKPLTEAQKKVLERLAALIQAKGYAPSFRELATALKLKSLNTVRFHLKQLEEKGYIHYPRYRSRLLQLKDSIALQSIKIPLLGEVPAGVPSLAVEEREEYIEVDPSLVKGRSFALRVKGDSMKDCGILPGDIVIVRLQNMAQNGDIVVARFEDDTTVKYFKQKKEGVFLVPANPNYSEIPAQDAKIIGRVTAVIRSYADWRPKNLIS